MKFTKDHEWVKWEGDVAVCGISDHAQHALGDVVSVELPDVGRHVVQNESVAIVDSMKASSDVYAPVSGEVVDVNSELNGHPEWINESPYEKGWFFKIKPSNPSQLDALMTEEQYQEFLKSESH